MTPDRTFRPGMELMSYLDGNLSSNGLDDPALAVQLFYLPWWTNSNVPSDRSSYLCSTSLKSALIHYRNRLANAMIPFGVPHTISNFARELNKPAYTWHASVNDNFSKYPNDCTRCRLYRSVAVGVMDQLRDTYNMVHACEISNEAEKNIAIRRASGFNELYEAALKKESERQTGPDSDSAMEHEQQSASASTGTGKERQRFGPEVYNLMDLTKRLAKRGMNASSKWTWGVDLTDDDLLGLIRGADRQNEIPHSGYDQDLLSGTLESMTSEARDPVNLEDPDDPELCFDELPSSIIDVPELRPHEIPTYLEVVLLPEQDVIDTEPDPVIEAFTKRAKAKAIKANKLLMQDEVNQPVSYRDYGSEFVPQVALIPRRPWLMPCLPIVLPPVGIDIGRTSSNVNIPHPDNHSDPIDKAESEMDEDIILPVSDDIPDHINIPELEDSLEIDFPVSDNELNNAMDVVRSDEVEIPMSNSGSDILFPESPYTTIIGGSGAVTGIERDPSTGRYTAASFANFPDEMLD